MPNDENYFRTIEYRNPEYIQCNVGLLPATWSGYRNDLEELVMAHKALFGEHKKGSQNYDDFQGTFRKGTYTDAWGCEWKNINDGLDALVVKHPLSHWSQFETYKPPEPGAGMPHGFMYMRLYYLRGFENFMIDLIEEPAQLQKLIDMVLSYNINEVRSALENSPRIVFFGDDLGNQNSLPMSPALWRKFLKPCYLQLFSACRDAGAHVYLHTDGHILDIIPDLIDCGITVLNPQFRANGIDGLIKQCKDRVAVHLDLDRQLFPFCTPEEIDEHVKEAVVKLGSKKGGLMLSAECGPDVPLKNIEAICSSFEKYRMYYN